MKGVWGQRATQCSDFASGLLSYSCGYRTYLRNTLVRSFKAAIRGTGPKVSYCGPETFLAGERQRQRLCDLSRPKPPSHQATKPPSPHPESPEASQALGMPSGPPPGPPFPGRALGFKRQMRGRLLEARRQQREVALVSEHS